jgi:N-acetylmuramoyl-L-alanine amidase
MIDPTMGRGAPPSGIKLLQPAAVKYLAVHCSATPTGRDIGAAELDAMHRQRGFLKIGYHYVIRLDGRVEKGRSDAEVGAHVEGHNSESIGICLVGGVDANLKPEAGFTDAQFGSLTTLVRVLLEKFKGAIVQGHRDFPNVSKACPSFDAKHWYCTGEVRA